MKKILFLLLSTVAMYGQVPADATPLENIQITNNTTDNSATKVVVQSTDGTINTISKSDLVNVVEVNDVPTLPLVGEVGKIYVVKNVNKIYRWNGTFYQELAGTDISGKEDVANKATDFTTVNNTLYPSLQAVKGQLNLKSDKLERVFYLSQHGCISDADLSLGSTTFGTNNTAAIQAVLNEASDGTPIKVIVDGKYSTNLLTIYSNTTIEATSQSNGFILRSNQYSPMFINSSVEDTGTIVNENIVFKGGIYNFNGANQEHDNTTYGFISGMNLVGVKNVWVQDVIFYQPATFTLWFINWENIHISGCKIDVGTAVDNADGFHFNGKGRWAWVENNIFRTKDDAIAINADDALPNTIPYQTYGDISDVYLKNNTLIDCRFGIRVLSGSSKIDNIVIDGLFGDTAIYAIIVDNFWQQHATYTNLDGTGNIDNLTIKNINVKVTPLAIASPIYKSIINISVIVRNLIIDNVSRNYSGYTDSSMIIIDQPDTVIENATITNIYDWVDSDSTNVPLLTVGDATIRKLTLSNIYKKRSSLVDAPILDLQEGTINEIIYTDSKTDNVRSHIKIGATATVNDIKMSNILALNKTITYPLILNNSTVDLLQAKNSYDLNLWAGSGSIAKVWSDNNFPESVYGVTEPLSVSDGRLATTKFAKDLDATSIKNSGAQKIGASTSTDAVLTLREDSTLSSALSLRNRNDTQDWRIAVDELAVDDGALAFIDRSAGPAVKMSLTKTGIIQAASYTGGATLTGTPTAPTAPAGTNTTQIATTAFVQATKPYKVYTALLTQTGTSAPVATVLENTLGGTVVWTRNTTGVYFGTLTGAYTSGKTHANINPILVVGGQNMMQRASADVVQLNTYSSGTGADSILNAQSIEIRVYN